MSRPRPKRPEECNSIEEIRREIDRIDRSIVQALGERAAYVHRIVAFKRSVQDVHAQERQQAMWADRRRWAQEQGLDPDMVEALFRGVVAHFVEKELGMLTDRDASP